MKSRTFWVIRAASAEDPSESLYFGKASPSIFGFTRDLNSALKLVDEEEALRIIAEEGMVDCVALEITLDGSKPLG